MDKNGFLARLQAALADLPAQDVARSTAYWAEMIDDRMEDGLSEAEAVQAMGDINAIAAQIRAESTHPQTEDAPTPAPRRMPGWTVALLALTAVVWIPLVLAAVIVALALYISVWAVMVSLCAVVIGLGAAALAGAAGAVGYLLGGMAAQALLTLGAGLLCAGLTVLLAVGLAPVLQGIWRFGCNALSALAARFKRGEAQS